MKVKNVLVLDAARPGSMAALKILKKSDLNVRTIACDSDAFSPAQLFADEYMLIPRVTHSDYPTVIKKVIEQYEVDLVLPTFHFGFEQLSALGLDIFVTDFVRGRMCQDKLLFYERCKALRLPVPPTRLFHEVSNVAGAVYIKPRHGVGGRDNYQANNDEEYQAVKVLARKISGEYLVQDMLYGAHWSAQCIADETGLISATTYITHEFKVGTSSRIEIIPHEGVLALAEDVQRKLGLTGAFHIQTMIDSEGRISIVEINPRHGSAVEFLSLAGCKIFHYWVTGDKKYLQPAKPGTYVKYFEVGNIA